MLKTTVTGLTHTGTKRAENEDAVVWLTHPDTDRVLAIVADGMGGCAGGAIASRLAIETCREQLAAVLAKRQASPEHIEFELLRAITAANRQIRTARGQNAEFAKMGTTLVLALVDAGTAYLAHIGDSRCYLLTADQLELKTRDDSVVQAMLDAGEIAESDVARVPFRNVLTKALGVEPEVSATLSTVPVGSGDTLILCSDGVTNALPSALWVQLMERPGGIAARAQALINACLENEAADNVSVIMIDFHEIER